MTHKLEVAGSEETVCSAVWTRKSGRASSARLEHRGRKEQKAARPAAYESPREEVARACALGRKVSVAVTGRRIMLHGRCPAQRPASLGF